MKIDITRISVAFANMSTYSEQQFVIIAYMVDWEYTNPITFAKLSGQIRTKQINDQQKVYAEINESIKEAIK